VRDIEAAHGRDGRFPGAFTTQPLQRGIIVRGKGAFDEGASYLFGDLDGVSGHAHPPMRRIADTAAASRSVRRVPPQS
jgi:hypothetical protein